MKKVSLAIGPYDAVLWRSFFAAGYGLVGMAILRPGWPSASVMRLHVIRGIVATFVGLTFFYAIVRLPIAETIALAFIAPIVALYLSAVMLGEKVGRRAIWASVLGLGGVIVIASGRLAGRYDEEALLGVGSVLISAVLFGWNLILQRQQAQVASPVEVGFWQSVVVSITLGVAAPWFAHMPPAEQFPGIALGAALVFASLLILSWAYGKAEAQLLIPTEYSAFLWACLLGWLFFAERLTWFTLGGTVLIVAGCIIAARAKPELAPQEEPIG